ncbi:DUF6894 family protein [Bradyrhizobium sp.]|uniref:DUF6894 family protein n=1 Tax=Bradyrhizobium sp. TaxID=376 RepID=UPI0039E3D725
MTRYYFDLRDGDELALDQEGLELPAIEAAEREAVRSLAELARGEVLISRRDDRSFDRLGVEVRDDSGPLFKVRFFFESDRTRH